MKGETFEDARARMLAQDQTGAALGDARWGRGERLTEVERGALRHDAMWGSAGYPVRRVRSRWIIDHESGKGFPMFRTRREAEAKWETLLACFRRLAGLEAQERHVKGAR